METKPVAFAEVVESTPHSFEAQCWQWNVMPQFGALVTVPQGEDTVIGIIYNVKTISLDPMRAQNTYQKSENELHKEYPHVFSFLRTTCSVLPLCVQSAGKIRYLKIQSSVFLHSFISHADKTTLYNFFSSQQYIQLITAAENIVGSAEELIFALIQQQNELSLLDQITITNILSAYATCTNSPYHQLSLFANRVQQICGNLSPNS